MRVRAIRVAIVIVAMMGLRGQVERRERVIVMEDMDMDMDMIMGNRRKGKGGLGVQMHMRGCRRIIRLGGQGRRVEDMIEDEDYA